MLQQQINDSIKACMKAKEKTKLSGLRMLNAAIKNKEIDTKKELSDEDIVKVIKKQIKEHEQSLSFLNDLETQQEEILKYRTYISILEDFLPEEMDVNKVRIIIMQELSKHNITFKSQMGEAMKACKAALANTGVDNSVISTIVREFLV